MYVYIVNPTKLVQLASQLAAYISFCVCELSKVTNEGPVEANTYVHIYLSIYTELYMDPLTNARTYGHTDGPTRQSVNLARSTDEQSSDEKKK